MEDSEKAHYDAMVRDLDVVDDWAKRVDPSSGGSNVQPGSPLAGDDRHANPHYVSHSAWRSLSTAVDHIQVHRAVVRDAATLHLYAPYTLLRGAFENAATAVWLLSPDNRNVRICRTLRLAAKDIKGDEKIRVLMGVAANRPVGERLAKLEAIADRRGIDRKQALERLPITEVVQTVGDETEFGRVVATVIWSLCSGTAHGDFWPMLSLQHHVEIPGAPPGVAYLHATTDVEKMAVLTYHSVKMIEKAWRLLDQRARTPY
ncbi:hypothetical protein AB0J82_20850 [Asanoa sp. NPDC049518]|uniref:hypothetical protein n=1 Tax=unclassified Asanoa TaxID=2685164 RepID=UPI00343F7CE0